MSYTVKRRKGKTQPFSEMPKSVSIGDVLKAGKLCVPKAETQAKLVLEQYDLTSHIWFKKEEQLFTIQAEKFAEGGFREAYKAYTVENGNNKLWVIKKFKKDSWDKVAEVYGMTLEEHTRKQVQMHMAAQAIANRLVKKCRQFTTQPQWFVYSNAYFSILGDEPVTVELYVEGDFVKYVNNDGQIGQPIAGKKTFYEKAEALTHFSYEESDGRLLLVDLQGSGYRLYDPEIATPKETESKSDSKERSFCGGNLNEMAFDNFFNGHNCNIYCKMLSLAEVLFSDEEEKDDKEN